MMVIKTIATFANRPLRWFALLAVPMMLVAMALFAHVGLELGRGATQMSWPLAGTGVLLMSSAVILLLSGALGELIYYRGDLRDREFLKLTLQMKKASTDSPSPAPAGEG